eukprot:COSAG02_NODE_4024_length_5890_cov_2.925574_3_plen_125_part_00
MCTCRGTVDTGRQGERPARSTGEHGGARGSTGEHGGGHAALRSAPAAQRGEEKGGGRGEEGEDKEPAGTEGKPDTPPGVCTRRLHGAGYTGVLVRNRRGWRLAERVQYAGWREWCDGGRHRLRG